LACVSLSEMKLYRTMIILEKTNSLLHLATASHSSCVVLHKDSNIYTLPYLVSGGVMKLDMPY